MANHSPQSQIAAIKIARDAAAAIGKQNNWSRAQVELLREQLNSAAQTISRIIEGDRR